MPDERLAALAGEKYINLTTFRRDGTAVPTPVWFALDGERILVWTIPTSGKAKRIRNNPRVTVAPCTARGKATGAAIPATATFLPDGDAARANDLMNKHYGFQKRLLDGVKWLIRTVRRMPRIENGFLVITPA